MDNKSIICDFENLYKAYRRAKSGKKKNSSCARFQAMSVEGIHILREQLKNQTYRMDSYNEFKIYEPCLLYTSPSPRDGLLSRMPSSA